VTEKTVLDVGKTVLLAPRKKTSGCKARARTPSVVRRCSRLVQPFVQAKQILGAQLRDRSWDSLRVAQELVVLPEVSDSRDEWEAFAQQLMPPLANAGIELTGLPEIFEVHNIIRR
jgi:hypothetical protein